VLFRSGGLAAFLAAHPAVERGALARQLEVARKERASGKPPGAGRALFRMISSALEDAAAAADAARDGDGDGDSEDGAG
jgi:ribosomal 50S subunit-associated protein YjgA (DUF615 family)